jgi:hypothetical protein
LAGSPAFHIRSKHDQEGVNLHGLNNFWYPLRYVMPHQNQLVLKDRRAGSEAARAGPRMIESPVKMVLFHVSDSKIFSKSATLEK